MQRTELHLGLVTVIAVLAAAGVAAAQPAGGTPTTPHVTCSASEAGVSFVCGPKDVEDIIPVPGSDWLIAGETGLAGNPSGLAAINTRTKT